MANISKSVDIIFNGVDGLSSPVKGIVKALKAFEQVTESIAAPIAKVVDDLFKLETAAVAVALAIGGLSLNNFKSYEYAIIDLKKVLSPNELPDFESVRHEIDALAVQYGLSTNSIIENTTGFKKAGFDINESMELVNRALELASAGNTTSEIAMNALIRTVKGFKLEIGETTHVVDAINVVSDKYATNVEELAIALARVAPVAKAAGLGINETIALITPAIEVFGTGEESSTAWRRALTKLTDNAAPVEKALDSLGIKQRDLVTGALRPGVDVLHELIAAYETMAESDKLFIASEIFGNRQAVKLLTTLGNQNYVMGIESTAAAVNHEYTMKQVQDRWESLDNQWRSSIVTIEQASRALGGRLAPAASKVIGAVSQLFLSIRDNLEKGAFQPLFSILEDLGTSISEYLLAIGKNLPDVLSGLDYSKLVDAFKGLFGEIQGVFNNLDLTSPEGLKTFLQEVVDTSASAIRATQGIIAQFIRFGEVVVNIIKNFNDLDSSQQVTLGSAAGKMKLIESMGLRVLFVLEQMENDFYTFGDALTRFAGALEIIGNSLGFLETIIQFFADGVGSFSAALGDLLHLDFKGASDEAIGWFRRLNSEANKELSGIGNGIKKVFMGLEAAPNSTEKIVDSLERVRKSTVELGPTMNDTINSWLKDFNKVDEKSSDTIDTVKQSLKDLNKYMGAQSYRPFEVDESALSDWNAYVKSHIDVVEETTDRLRKNSSIVKVWKSDILGESITAPNTGTGVFSETLGAYDDFALSLYRAVHPTLTKLDDELSATANMQDVDIEPPADEKFKAAQALLRDEVKYSADVVKSQYDAMSETVKANSEVMAASLDAISNTYSSTTDSVSELYKTLVSGDLNLSTKSSIQTQIRSQQDQQQEAFELQKKLTEAQIDLIQRRAQSLESGEALVTVSGEGLQPHLEAFMWEILSAIQIKVSETYNNFLIGVTA